MESSVEEYPLFAVTGKEFKIDINETFKNDQELKVIGIYNEKYTICFKQQIGEVLLFELDCNDKNNHFKKYSNICKKHKDCKKNTKFVNNDTIFIECLFCDDYYHYSILNLSNDNIYESDNYNYGRSFPISNELINEWSRIQLPTNEPNKTIELIKVDCFNFVSKNDQYQMKYFNKLSIDNQSKSGDDIIEHWSINREDLFYPIKIQEPYLLIFTKSKIIVHNFIIEKTWSIDFNINKINIEDGSFITNIKNTLIHWNRHSIGNENYLYLNIWDIEKGNSIKSIKVDEKYSKLKPPTSIQSINNNNLIIINPDNEIHTLKFN
ncbi:hypothetical protein ACTA71_010133 [Dictyostelium dimigraforme]